MCVIMNTKLQTHVLHTGNDIYIYNTEVKDMNIHRYILSQHENSAKKNSDLKQLIKNNIFPNLFLVSLASNFRLGSPVL